MKTLCRQLEWHPGVEVTVIHFDDWSTSVEYVGKRKALIAARVATAKMIAPGTKGKPRVDHEGYRFIRTPLSADRYSLRFPDVDSLFAVNRPGVEESCRRLVRRDQAFQRFIDTALGSRVAI